MYSFPKEEHLKSKKAIELVFTKGTVIYAPPIKLIFLETTISNSSGLELKAAFSVPKRSFRLAVKRNLIKRRMRESFRLCKPRFNEKLDRPFNVIFSFTEPKEADFKTIDKGINKALSEMLLRVSKGK